LAYPRGIEQSTLAAIRVAGDSMDGTLADGDMVLIDRSRIKPDGVLLFGLVTDCG